MIEITEIAKEAVKTITPFLLIGGKEIIKNSAADLWKLIKGVVKNKDDERLIDDFEVSPSDLNLQGRLLTLLESSLKDDINLTASLADIVKTVQGTEEYNNYVSQVGDNNISVAGKISNSTINIGK